MSATLTRYGMRIGGIERDSQTGEWMDVINPATGEKWAEVPAAGPADVDAAVAAATKALKDPSWRNLSPMTRADLLRRLGDRLKQEAGRIAELETRCNGKIIRETTAQMNVIPNWFYYFAGAADKLFGQVIPLDKTTVLNYTLREPIGVVVAIVPWNSPLLLATYKLAPALAAGNTIIIKPAETTPITALELVRLAEDIGFPPGVLNVVTGYGPVVGAALAAHPGVNKVAFTGGTETGREVVRQTANNLAKLTLELGGKSPNIVFEDADLEAALNGVIAGIFAATGQTCIAGSRLMVHERVHDELLGRVVERAKRIKMGDPLQWETEMGPASTPEQLAKIRSYADIGVKEGARLLVGGSGWRDGVPSRGFFFPPTVFDDVNMTMRIAREEIFGPVLSAITFKDEDQAVALANGVPYGLAAGLWTRDLKRAHRVAGQIEAGTIWVNTYRSFSPASPFGGYKQSGYGRENSLDALHEYTQVKSIWVDLSNETRDPFVMR